MSLKTYTTDVAKISRFVLLGTMPGWSRLLRNPEDRKPARLRSHARSQVLPVVRAGRFDAAESARSFYDDQRLAFADETRDVDILVSTGFDQLWEKLEREIDETNLANDLAMEGLASRLGGAAEKDVIDGARTQLIDQVADDPIADRWARVSRGGFTCGFCTILVSRGAVYAEDTKDFLSHKFCDCVSVPVFKGAETWDGKDQYDAANRLYVAASKRAKESGRSIDAEIARPSTKDS